MLKRIRHSEPVPDHPLLNGRAEIGRGSNSTIIEKDDERVYKLVSCPASYQFLVDPDRPDNPHFVAVHADHGEIARTRARRLPVHLLEIERLYPLAQARPSAVALAQSITMSYLTYCRVWAHFGENMGNLALESMLKAMPMSAAMRGAIRALDRFTADIGALPDLIDPENLMVRRDGTLVFSDPVFSWLGVCETPGDTAAPPVLVASTRP